MLEQNSLELNIKEPQKKKKKKLQKPSTTATDLFRFVIEFGKLHNVRDQISLYYLDNQIQKTKTDIFGIF